MRFAVLAIAAISLATVYAEDAPAPTDADAKAKLDAIAEAVKGGEEGAVKEAIKSAGDCPHLKVIGSLQGIILSGNPDSWRVAAAAALGRMKGNKDAAAALNATLEKTDSKIAVFRAVCNAIEDLAMKSSSAALEAFARARVSKHDKEDLPAVEAALNAMGAISTKANVEAVIDLWRKCKYSGRDPHQNFKEKVAQYCRKALQRLTGEKVGNYAEWDDWWEHERDKLNDDLSRK